MSGNSEAQGNTTPTPRPETPRRPDPTAIQGQDQVRGKSTSTVRGTDAAPAVPKKRKNHRGKKKRARRQSFAPSDVDDGAGLGESSRNDALRESQSAARESFYRVQGTRNMSNTSLESEALLDHRCVACVQLELQS